MGMFMAVLRKSLVLLVLLPMFGCGTGGGDVIEPSDKKASPITNKGMAPKAPESAPPK